jgi:hypothetical protein
MAISRNDRTKLRDDTIEYIGNGGGGYRTRARLLAELDGLSDDAYISAKHAAAFIDTTYAQLANWRLQRRGPKFVGARKFVRYKLADLKAFMASRAMDTAPLNDGPSNIHPVQHPRNEGGEWQAASLPEPSGASTDEVQQG